MPQKAAGWRIEPPVSVPSAAGSTDAATSAAEPPEEPPGARGRGSPLAFHGLTAGPKYEVAVEEPMANSSRLVLAASAAPAAASLAVTVDS